MVCRPDRTATRPGPGARLALLASLILGLILSAAGNGASAADATTLTLVAYSTPREAYEALMPAFQQTDAGKDIEFETSFGSSGEQSRAVEGGLPADIVALSLEPDITRLVKGGLVADDWNAGEEHGMVTDSVVVLAMRKGNPKNIAGWDDLIKDGVEVITPNPLTSGGARWNVMAAYGAQIKAGKTKDEAVDYLDQLFANVPVQDKSARESLQTFVGGKGDVLLAYENEVITAQQKGEDLEFIVPDQTILIENPIAVVKETKHAEQAQAFIDYLRTPEAQRVFGEKGYRPIDPTVLAEFKDDYPTPATLFSIDDLGGWSDVSKAFFDPTNGIVAKIQQD